jgi:glycerol kinase
LEGIALSVADLLRAMATDQAVQRMRVDGGAAANDLLMQFQSDVSTVVIERPRELESTARGAAMLAGVGARFFASPEEALRMSKVERTFTPAMPEDERQATLRQWDLAVRRARLE